MLEWSEIGGLLRFAGGLRTFLSSTVTPEQARQIIRDRLARRSDLFLSKINRAVFQNPKSPYLQLMRSAGCDFADVELLAKAEGVEDTLKRLASAGVYVTWEEFKGRVPVRRGGREWLFQERDFDNLLVREDFHATSGGTTGAPVRMRMNLEDMTEAAPDWCAWFHAHGWIGRPLIFWTPNHTGMASRYLKCAKFGMRYRKWFVSMEMKAAEDRLRSSVIHALARQASGLPAPERAPVNRPEVVGDYLLALLRDGENPLVSTAPSAAARLSLFMLEQRKRLDGTTFLLGAEPVTPARKATIELSGAAAVPTYGTSEGGWIGAQFPGAPIADEVHLFRDAYAAVSREDMPADDYGARPILFTNLRNASPKVLLNAELGDSAVLTSGTAGAASELGFDVGMHTIRSLRKVTAWGVTLAVGDLYPILEDVMPRKFGGSASDYQFVEDQDERGMPVLRLLISPEVGEIAVDAVRETFFREMSRRRSYYSFMTALLDQAGALRIERRHPVRTSRDKLLPVLPNRGS